MASSTFLPASFMAAAMRSCSISRSSAFTIAGSMVTRKTCFCPFIFTVTVIQRLIFGKAEVA